MVSAGVLCCGDSHWITSLFTQIHLPANCRPCGSESASARFRCRWIVLREQCSSFASSLASIVSLIFDHPKLAQPARCESKRAALFFGALGQISTTVRCFFVRGLCGGRPQTGRGFQPAAGATKVVHIFQIKNFQFSFFPFSISISCG